MTVRPHSVMFFCACLPLSSHNPSLVFHLPMNASVLCSHTQPEGSAKEKKYRNYLIDLIKAYLHMEIVWTLYSFRQPLGKAEWLSYIKMRPRTWSEETVITNRGSNTNLKGCMLCFCFLMHIHTAFLIFLVVEFQVLKLILLKRFLIMRHWRFQVSVSVYLGYMLRNMLSICCLFVLDPKQWYDPNTFPRIPAN